MGPPLGWRWVGALALGLFGLSWFGLKVATLSGMASPVWPAAGLGIWAVLRGGPRMLWGVYVGAFLCRPFTDSSPGNWPFTALGPVVGAWLGALIIRQLRLPQRRWREFAAPLGYVGAAVGGGLVSAAIGAASLGVTGVVPVAALPGVAVTWWMGDLFGALLVVPLLEAVWLQWRGQGEPRRGWGWALLAMGSAVGVCGLAFFSPSREIWLFAVFPPLLLGKHWWPRIGTQAVAGLIVAIAIVAAVRGVGPFAGGELNDSLLRLHGFLGCVVLTALALPIFRAYGGMRLASLILMLGWLVSAGVYTYQHRTARLADEAHLRAEVQNAEAAIVERIEVYSQALRAGEAIFSTFGDVNHEQWRRFSQSLELRTAFPGINGIGVIWPVTDAELPAFVAEMGRNRGDDFALRTVPGVSPPEATESGDPEHYVIGYIEPEAINRQAIGLDVGAEANRRTAADAARDSGRPHMTKRIKLVQDGKQRGAFLLYLPVYDQTRPTGTVEQRRAAFRHWIYAPFVTESFLQGVLPGVTQEVAVDLFEGDGTAPRDLVYAGATPVLEIDAAAGVPPTRADYDYVTHLQLAGESFTLGWRRTAAFASPDATTPVWVGSGLALLSLVLAGLITVLQRSGDHARDLVEARTGELAEVNARMEALLAMQQGVLDGNTFSIISTGLDGVISFFNRGAEQMLGYARDEMVGKTSPALIHLPEEIEARAAQLSRELRETIEPGFEAFIALPQRGRVDEREWTYVRKDGTRVPVLLTLSGIRDQVGNLTGYLGVAQDLTARKQAEASRKAAVVELTVLKQALDLHVEISVTDRNGRIVYVNSRFCQSSGYAAEELLGRTHRLLNSGVHDPGFFKHLWDTLLAGETWRGTVCNRAKNGRHYWLDTVVMPELDERGLPRRFVSIRTDVTQRKEYEAGLSRARDEAMALSQLKSEFLANISHELRTPMNGVIGMAGLLADTASDPEQKHMIEVIRNSGENLLTIINDILDLAKMESGKMRMVAAEFDLQRTLTETIELLTPRAEASNILLTGVLGDPIGFEVLGDEGRLRQIVVNLLGNAIKFTRGGAVELRLLVGAPTGDRLPVRIEVQDTGCGIAPEMQERLFQPFVQVDGSATRAHGGTGLGLAISRQIVELMGGRIGLSSVPGEGSTFWFEIGLARGGRLPVSRPAARSVPAANAWTVPTVEAGAERYRILLVEDNAANREVASRLLQRLGHEVDFAHNGEVALEQLALQKFDLVLMDCQMPVMDGFETTRRLRGGAVKGADARIPVIALTAYAMASDRERCLAAGMDEYLQKPMRPPEVSTAIQRVMAQRWADAPPVRAAAAMDGPATVPVLDEEIAAELDEIPADDGGTIFDQVATGVLQEIESCRPLLATMLAEANWTELAPLAHRLGGSAALFGGVTLRAGFIALERLAKAGDAEAAAAQWIVVQEQFEQLRVAVLARLERTRGVSTSPDAGGR